MTNIPFIPESAPFTVEQRAWLNGFLAGLFASVPAAQPLPPATASQPAAPLLILFGSQTGTAENLARKLAGQASQRGFAPQVLPLNEFQQALAAGVKAIIVSSTWGDGDPPDNAAGFWSWLSADSAPRLEQIQYAVLGLGDRNYPDFCGASKKFDERLAALGAERLIPRGECDVDYETVANDWIQKLWPILSQKPEVNAASVNSDSHGAGALTATPEIPNAKNGAHAAGASSYGRHNPFPARLVRNVILNKPGSAKEVRHYELDLAPSGLSYQVGDALGVLPVNCPELVNDMMVVLGGKPDDPVTVAGANMALHEALSRHLDITKPSPELLALLAKAVSDSDLAQILTGHQPDKLKAWLHGRGVIDLLRLFPGPLGLTEILAAMKKLAPRLYSISSSPKANPGRVHLTVSSVRYQSHGLERKGVASTFLADRVGDADFVKLFVQPSGFKPPPGSDTPMIMVGPGTGIAPFRAFLQERKVTGASGKNWLFFGDQTRAGDFLYESELTSWQKDGLLTQLHLAFSRDQPEKVYVQNRMLENASQLWGWLDQGAYFYVCGDAARMAKDVDGALHKIIETAGNKSPEEAKAFVAQLKAQKRYQRDVY